MCSLSIFKTDLQDNAITYSHSKEEELKHTLAQNLIERNNGTRI